MLADFVRVTQNSDAVGARFGSLARGPPAVRRGRSAGRLGVGTSWCGDMSEQRLGEIARSHALLAQPADAMALPMKAKPKWDAVLCCGVALLGFGACGSDFRAMTYGPNVRYVEREAVQGAMQQLAAGVFALDRILREDAAAEPEKQSAALAQLDMMDRAARALSGAGPIVSHPLLDTHLDRFLDDIREAKRAVSGTPPDYFQASHLTGACLYCHTGR